MNAMTQGLLGPSEVLLLLDPDLQHVKLDGEAPAPGPRTVDPRVRRFSRRDEERARLSGEPWRPRI